MEEDEPIDESDPLWIITLQLAGGDRAAALKVTVVASVPVSVFLCYVLCACGRQRVLVCIHVCIHHAQSRARVGMHACVRVCQKTQIRTIALV